MYYSRIGSSPNEKEKHLQRITRKPIRNYIEQNDKTRKVIDEKIKLVLNALDKLIEQLLVYVNGFKIKNVIDAVAINVLDKLKEIRLSVDALQLDIQTKNDLNIQSPYNFLFTINDLNLKKYDKENIIFLLCEGG
ncbi:MAG: hypothetical protein EZS28_000742 [Streblomastix strix]|uniref:Uncharacterized protein n=1 Tax=Streblomastix strix TaxID=222440 RepID=A0A5J4X9G8_9EUKA|nr:MAG: hypothetical protein EZS28_000742 [Streblomastix strix]